MQINELPSLGRALQSGDKLAVDDANGVTYKVDAENINPTPSAISIPASRWSGSGSDYYITVTASNVTADSILIPQYDVSSAALLNGPVWCVPAAGSFTIHTSAKPSGTVTILVLFPGTMGEAQAGFSGSTGVSKKYVDDAIQQSTASITLKSKLVTLPDFTIPAYGYYRIADSKPTGMNKFLFAVFQAWDTITPAGPIAVTSTGNYVVGTPNAVVKGLKVEYFYTD